MKKIIFSAIIILTVFTNYSCTVPQPIKETVTVTTTITPSKTISDTPTKKSTTTILPIDVTQTEAAFQSTEQAVYGVTKTETYKTLVSSDNNCINRYSIATPWDTPYVDVKYITSTDQWSVISCMYWGDYETDGYTRIANNSNTKKYFILYDDINLWDFGFLSVFHFDKQNQFLYFRPAARESGSGGLWGQGFGGGGSVFQLDLQTGDTNVIVPIPYDLDFQVVKFSPDINYIAYASSVEPNTMKILNTKTGQPIYTVELEADVTMIGDFVWTDDQKYIFYVAGHEGWKEQKSGFSLYRFDFNTQENDEILHNDMRVLMPYNFGYSDPWIDKQTLRLGAYYYDGYDHDNTFYKLDINSGEITVGGELDF